MLDVQALSYEPRAFFGHSPQPFFAFVGERDAIKVDNAGSLVLALMRPLLGCSQLTDPGPDQASLRNPSRTCRHVHNGDPQHGYLSCVRCDIRTRLSPGVRSHDNTGGNADARTRRISVTMELIDLF